MFLFYLTFSSCFLLLLSVNHHDLWLCSMDCIENNLQISPTDFVLIPRLPGFV